jgi:hypothetical protein
MRTRVYMWCSQFPHSVKLTRSVLVHSVRPSREVNRPIVESDIVIGPMLTIATMSRQVRPAGVSVQGNVYSPSRDCIITMRIITRLNDWSPRYSGLHLWAVIYLHWPRHSPHARLKSDYRTNRSPLQYWPKVNHGPAHFIRASSSRNARHLQYMNRRHTRNKRVMKRVSNASWSACQMQLWRANVAQCCANAMWMLCECYADATWMLRECCANVTRMLYRWGALHMREIRVHCRISRKLLVSILGRVPSIRYPLSLFKQLRVHAEWDASDWWCELILHRTQFFWYENDRRVIKCSHKLTRWVILLKITPWMWLGIHEHNNFIIPLAIVRPFKGPTQLPDCSSRSALQATRTHMPFLPVRYPFNNWVRWGKETYPESHADSGIRTHGLLTASQRPEPYFTAAPGLPIIKYRSHNGITFFLSECYKAI